MPDHFVFAGQFLGQCSFSINGNGGYMLRLFLGLIVILGGAISLGLSLTFAYLGEFDKAQTLALYTILACLMIGQEK